MKYLSIKQKTSDTSINAKCLLVISSSEEMGKYYAQRTLKTNLYV